MMNLKHCLVLFLIPVSLSVYSQTGVEASQKKTKQLILKILSEYKNPMGYYPIRRDIFLPSEEEMTKDEMKKSYPKSSRSLGFVVFIPANDTTYYREPFIEANGDLLDLTNLNKRNYPSMKNNSTYFRKRQLTYLNRSPSYSRFVRFNATYGAGTN